LIGAALTVETARWMGPWVDGLITAGRDAKDHRKIIDAFREAGGDGKPVFLQSAISFAATEDEARRQAHREWRHCAISGDLIADLAAPWDFEAATREVTPEEVSGRLRVSADHERHIAWLQEDSDTGFDAVFVHQIARDMDRFIDTFASKVLPALQAS
jgi:alkanesulfonate monooxygenase SsuD/methylene tetrahydromethanopterin reductase-like flavin-dependent oxidoreductase (luciferase family)